MDPLEEAPYDPLEESYRTEDLDFVKGGSDPEYGFASSVQEARKRMAFLNSDLDVIDDKKMLSRAKKRAFLAAFCQCGIVSMAAAAAGVSTGSIYYARKNDPDFAEMFKNANEVAGDVVEMAILQRAVHGVEEDVFGKTKDGFELIGKKTVYSDSLLALLAKARKPEQYRERFDHKHDTESKGGVLLVPGVISLEQWSLAAAQQQAQYRETPEET